MITLDLFSDYSDMISVLDNKMRMLVNLENILYEETFHNKNKNLSLRLERLFILFLYNLNHKGASNILVNKLQSSTIESSVLKNYGFIELLNIDYLEVLVSTNLETKDKDFKLLMKTIEVNLCKDSFEYIIQFVNNLKSIGDEVKAVLKPEVVTNIELNSKL